MIKKFQLPKYYEVEINLENGLIKIYSNSKHKKGKELAQYKNKDGYLKVKMNNKNVFIHTIISKLFLGERPLNYVVNHKDGNKLNNKPDNLEYVTISENIKHSIEFGMHICNRPELIGNYKDGRCKDLVSYKKSWYQQNKDRILLKMKNNYRDKKKCS
jgi:hypothetical protein